MNTELIVWLDRRFDKIEQKLSVLTEQLSSLQPIPPNRLVDIKGAAVITRLSRLISTDSSIRKKYRMSNSGIRFGSIPKNSMRGCVKGVRKSRN